MGKAYCNLFLYNDYPKLEQLAIYYKHITYKKSLKKPREKNLGLTDGK